MDTPQRIDAADTVLALALSSGVPRIRHRLDPVAIESLSGHGVTLRAEQKFRPEEEWDVGVSAADARVADVDIDKVLSDSLAPFGFSLGKSLEEFIQLHHPDAPTDCGIFFLRGRQTPAYAIRALAQQPILIVLHVDDRIEDARMNQDFAALGLHCTRLRNVRQLDPAALQELVNTLGPLRTAVEQVSTPRLESVVESRKAAVMAEPARVMEYASTQQDTLFETATSQILAPMFDHTIPLGAAFRGSPVPDGFVMSERREGVRPVMQVASYDCKSRKQEMYDFKPEHADQQSRYLGVQERLVERGWESHGLLLFVPEARQAELDERILKETWQRLLRNGRSLIIVPSKVLKRWWELRQQEDDVRLRSFLRRPLIWRALFSARLPADEGQLSSVFFARAGAPARILTEEDAELIWIAGLNHDPATEVHLSESLKDTDPLNERADGLTARLALPAVLYRFYVALGQKRDLTLDALAAETQLSRKAVQYLVISQPYRSIGAWLGEHVVPNTKRLAREVRSSLSPTRSEED